MVGTGASANDQPLNITRRGTAILSAASQGNDGRNMGYVVWRPARRFLFPISHLQKIGHASRSGIEDGNLYRL